MGTTWWTDPIDVEIQPLVTVLNAFGVRTISSCAGHIDGPHGVLGYVHFVADQARVRALVDAVWQWRRFVVRRERGYDRGYEGAVNITVWPVLDRPDVDPTALMFCLEIHGSPIEYQRAEIAALVQALDTALQARTSSSS